MAKKKAKKDEEVPAPEEGATVETTEGVGDEENQKEQEQAGHGSSKEREAPYPEGEGTGGQSPGEEPEGDGDGAGERGDDPAPDPGPEEEPEPAIEGRRLDVAQTARRLNLSPRSVYRLIHKGYLKAAKFGPLKGTQVWESSVREYELAREEEAKGFS